MATLSMLVVLSATTAVMQARAARPGKEWSPQLNVRPLRNSDLQQIPFVLSTRQKVEPSTPPVFPPPQETAPDVEGLRKLNTPRSGINTIAPEPPPAGARPSDRTAAVTDTSDGGVPFVQPVDELPSFDHWDRPLVVPADVAEPFPVTFRALIKKDGRVGRLYVGLGPMSGARTEAERRFARQVLQEVVFNSRFRPARRAGQPVDCWVAVTSAQDTR